MKKLNKNNGITLIALVISIIVMLILVAVSISMAVNGGLFNYAGKAVGDTQNAIDKEKELAEGRIKVGNTWYDSLQDVADGKPSANQGDGTVTTPENPGEGGGDQTDGETISTTESYIGYYADVDGDGTEDGVIYADLAFSKSGTWNPAGNTGTYATKGGAWSYSAKSNLKEYVISEETYNGAFGTKPVLKASSTEGTDRFYVMALSDVNPGTYYRWYEAAYDSGISDYTNYSYEFGKGKTNTHNMITAWNGTTYGAQNDGSYKDVWGVIQKTVYGENYSKETKTEEDVIWFLPSANEWAAFGSAFDITTGKYSSTYGLEGWYWSSSLNSSNYACGAGFYRGYMGSSGVYDKYYVRLSVTF